MLGCQGLQLDAGLSFPKLNALLSPLFPLLTQAKSELLLRLLNPLQKLTLESLSNFTLDPPSEPILDLLHHVLVSKNLLNSLLYKLLLFVSAHGPGFGLMGESIVADHLCE